MVLNVPSKNVIVGACDNYVNSNSVLEFTGAHTERIGISMKRAIAVLLAAAIMLFAVGCGESAEPQSSSPSASPMASTDSAGMEVSVAEVEGNARLLRGDGTGEMLKQGTLLRVGDSVITDRDSTVKLQLSDLSATVNVSPSSEILLETADNAGTGRELIIVVRKGSISNSVDVKLEAGDIYEVCTGDMTMAIRGTDALVDCRDGVTSISLLTGYALIYNYYDGEVYIVPSGVIGRFMPEEEPVFELIELGSYAGTSEAAAALLEEVEADDRNFSEAESYEKKLRDSYLVEDGYTFRVTDSQVEDEEEIPTTTTAAVTTTVETTGTTTATTAAPTTARRTTTAPTTQPTVPSEPTEPTVPSEPTEPTVPSGPTEPTVPSESTAAKRYFYTLSGLYANTADGVVSLGGSLHEYGDITGFPLTVSGSSTADNGQTFSFSVTITLDNVDSYSDTRQVIANSATAGEYSSGEVFANLIIITY